MQNSLRHITLARAEIALRQGSTNYRPLFNINLYLKKFKIIQIRGCKLIVDKWVEKMWIKIARKVNRVSYLHSTIVVEQGIASSTSFNISAHAVLSFTTVWFFLYYFTYCHTSLSICRNYQYSMSLSRAEEKKKVDADCCT